ncbi:hypothetical protein [Reyranella sp.]|uniref:hypothetical protein n=1 Tax=Reyranella sp. TaxID=1929291 RepID=UPI004036D289
MTPIVVGQGEGWHPTADWHDAVEYSGTAQIFGGPLHDGLLVRGKPGRAGRSHGREFVCQ